MSHALARRFNVDVTADLTLASGWSALNAITDLKPIITPNVEDGMDYSTNGWPSREITAQDWTVTATYNILVSAGVYDAGQELIRARVGQFGNAARLGIRWYDNTGGPEAYSGIALVGVQRANTGAKNIDANTATFSGTDIPLNLNISNPYATASAPTILSATPSGVAATGLVQITGTGFAGIVATTGVKFGGVNATTWTVVSSNLLVAEMPAGSAGSAPIIVTNATGASAAFPYTRA